MVQSHIVIDDDEPFKIENTRSDARLLRASKLDRYSLNDTAIN